MKDKHDINLESFFDKNSLRAHIDFITVYIIVFEELSSLILNKPLDFFTDEICARKSDYKIEESNAYEKNVLTLCKKDRFKASLRWFKKMGALSDSEIKTILEVRCQRGKFVHNTINSILKGIAPKKEGNNLTQLLKIYFKLDKWWINNVEISTMSTDEIGEIYPDDNFSIRACLVKTIVDMLLLDNEDSYKSLLKMLKDFQKNESQI